MVSQRSAQHGVTPRALAPLIVGIALLAARAGPAHFAQRLAPDATGDCEIAGLGRCCQPGRCAAHADTGT